MADDNRGFRVFGFEIRRQNTSEQDAEKKPSIVPPNDEDGAGYVTAAGSHYGQYLNIDGDESKDNFQLIMKYRGVAMHPEVDAAVEDIVNEAIAGDMGKQNIDVNMDKLNVQPKIKDIIKNEFDHIASMLNFTENGHDIFRRWYVDGRLYHHLVIDETQPQAGIQEIRYIDSARMRKVKEVKKKKDPASGANLIEKVDEYYIYQEKPAGFSGAKGSAVGTYGSGVKMSADSVSYVTSGLLDESRKKVISYVHKALKPLNQLRMMEDSLVIYRLARAPERRIFYIDVGNLPRGKAEQYMKDIMTRYRNKLVYDQKTGEIKDDRKHQSLLEDFWLPRREGGKGTEIGTLPGGENLGQIDDILYFQKRLYKALNVPLNRLAEEQPFSLGRTTEISRDELKFQKFIDRLRTKFSSLFKDILKIQLILKGVIMPEDWDWMQNDINVDYVRDNHFSELKEMEVMRERIDTLNTVSNYVGVFFSKSWAMKNILQMNDEDIQQMAAEMQAEMPAQPEEPEMEDEL